MESLRKPNRHKPTVRTDTKRALRSYFESVELLCVKVCVSLLSH